MLCCGACVVVILLLRWVLGFWVCFLVVAFGGDLLAGLRCLILGVGELGFVCWFGFAY